MSSFRYILTFHGVGPKPRTLTEEEDAVWLDHDAFEEILDAIKALGRTWLTFDDGNASDLDIALPSLLRRNLKADFFISTGKVGCDGYLNASQVREIANAGMGIGNHGISHTSWRKLDHSDLWNELKNSQKKLEEIVGKPIDQASCPFGHYDRRVLSFLRRAGYSRVYTSDGGVAVTSHWLQPRTSLHRHDSSSSIYDLLSTNHHSTRNLIRRLKTAIKRRR